MVIWSGNQLTEKGTEGHFAYVYGFVFSGTDLKSFRQDRFSYWFSFITDFVRDSFVSWKTIWGMDDQSLNFQGGIPQIMLIFFYCK